MKHVKRTGEVFHASEEVVKDSGQEILRIIATGPRGMVVNWVIGIADELEPVHIEAICEAVRDSFYRLRPELRAQ